VQMDLSVAIAQVLSTPTTYVVGPADGSYLYKGSARSLKDRLEDHRAGRVSRTKNRRPVHQFFFRYFPTYSEARAFEMYLKSGAGRQWLREQLSHRESGQTIPARADRL